VLNPSFFTLFARHRDPVDKTVDESKRRDFAIGAQPLI
jgi:hypothetical protein